MINLANIDDMPKVYNNDFGCNIFFINLLFFPSFFKVLADIKTA